MQDSLFSHGTLVAISGWRDTDFARIGSARARWDVFQIRKGECFFNAYWLATTFKEHQVEYVEGLVVFGSEIVQHAWNAILGQHFDLTWEYHNPSQLVAPHYVLVSGTIGTLFERGYVFSPETMTMIEQFERQVAAGTNSAIRMLFDIGNQ